LDDLRVPPGNRLEALKGERAGQVGIRVNDQYRICFRARIPAEEHGKVEKRKIKLAPVHPGEILREDFMEPLALSINGLARALHVPANHVSGIVNEKRWISAKMALRLARYFGTSPELWLGLQQDYELDLARDTASAQIEKEVLPRAS
jgi:addiction module HigA family antidote